MNRLGERIKKKRELLHLQLNDLAKLVGITPSALSQIEKAKSFPSLTTIKTIANHLNSTVGELIGEHELLSRNPYIPYSEKKMVKTNESGATLYLLSYHDTGKLMDTYMVSFSAGADAGNLITNHQGQEFIFVFDGEVRVEVENENHTFNLRKGDSFYMNSGKNFRISNASHSSSEIVWIISPPTV
jgi:transcriptional regulator with XRE-family HTH domain